MSCIGLSQHLVMQFNDYNGFNHLELKTLFLQESIRRGVLFGLGQNPCYSHDENDLRVSLQVAKEAVDIIKQAVSEGNVKEYLKCEVAQEIVRRV
ncbi:MAG: hypothetical protein FIA99_10500 [Ruminiclostridium sp.]|nr:hypothetical protein [Ruminiclostridium sp.]